MPRKVANPGRQLLRRMVTDNQGPKAGQMQTGNHDPKVADLKATGPRAIARRVVETMPTGAINTAARIKTTKTARITQMAIREQGHQQNN